MVTIKKSHIFDNVWFSIETVNPFYAYYPLWVTLPPKGKISGNFTQATTSHLCESVCMKESTKTSQEGGGKSELA